MYVFGEVACGKKETLGASHAFYKIFEFKNGGQGDVRVLRIGFEKA